MTTVSQGPDAVAAAVPEDSHAIERAATAYTRPAPVENTIRPVWFVTITITILVIVAASVLAIWAGGSFDGGQPGLTSPAGG
ncbi:MAG TPA: hypothetical protein VLH10_05390 [Yinghuangia sp.]|uniref:hypothetical protein n=1 Tax=Yinghuangia sp. YIM S10712 TaxID=3436930 RepID=UPI002C06EF0E|nr:hypothetical protein [Yinghuangia sp.]